MDSIPRLESHDKSSEAHTSRSSQSPRSTALRYALAYAASMTVPVLALHVSPSTQEADRFHRYWRAWDDHLPLEVVVSPYRATLAPLANRSRWEVVEGLLPAVRGDQLGYDDRQRDLRTLTM